MSPQNQKEQCPRCLREMEYQPRDDSWECLACELSTSPTSLDNPGGQFAVETDRAYNERDRVVAMLAWFAQQAGWPVWLGEHVDSPGTGISWDPDWRTVVFIYTPQGQLSWHIHDSELPLFHFVLRRDQLPSWQLPSWVPGGPPLLEWDGHSTEEKYMRIERLTGVKR